LNDGKGWLHRVKGELLLVQNPPDVAEAERCFRKAIEVERRVHGASAGYYLLGDKMKATKLVSSVKVSFKRLTNGVIL
jgi:hypothetical protein